MVFSSVIFLFLYLPLVIGIYFILRKNWRNFFLLALSLLFYFWGENWLVLIMVTSTLIDYTCGLAIARALGRGRNGPIELLDQGGKRSWKQKLALVVSIMANLSILAFFKYFNFGMDNYNSMMGVLGLSSMQWQSVFKVTLPLGISFYTFQSMSYTIDVYLGNARATRHLLNFACFVTMFPQLVAGPIVRYRDIAKQLVDRVVTRDGFASGVRRFTIGLGKKVLLANTVAWPADQIFSLPSDQLTFGLAWLGVVCYSLQIYFDFSGYSDMAIGLGRMFGFRFLENFLYPYISRSIKEFWRRWHVSLSSWYRDYLYIPLGGGRGRAGRVYFNLVLVFFLCGLWHGAAWNFVIWGFFHGAFLVMERLGLEKLVQSMWRPFRHVYVLLVVMVGWVFFRADTLPEALSFLSAMSGFAEGSGAEHYLGRYMDAKLGVVMILGIIGSIPVFPWIVDKWRQLTGGFRPVSAGLFEGGAAFFRLAYLTLILLSCAMTLSSGAHNPFIYFRF